MCTYKCVQLIPEGELLEGDVLFTDHKFPMLLTFTINLFFFHSEYNILKVSGTPIICLIQA